jgi:hypothetical protein
LDHPLRTLRLGVTTDLSQRRKERKEFFGYQNSNGFLHLQNFVFPFLLAHFAPWRELFLSPQRSRRTQRNIQVIENFSFFISVKVSQS